jgi:multidrug efflux pump subunit AcrA (membrane-fusion protein)
MRPVRWLGLLGLLLPLVAACSTLAPRPVASERTVEREPVRTARAQRGEISGVLSLSGEIKSAGQQTLTARVAGRLDSVLVDVGSAIQQGQPLAEVDRAGFELRVVQGEAELAAAEARLAGLLAGGRPDETALAEAMLRGARARLEALERAPQGDSPEQILEALKAARQRLADLEANAMIGQAQSESALSTARARVEQLQRQPNAQQNQAALAQARQELQQAETAAAQARRPATSADLGQARQEVQNLQDALILSRNSVSQAELAAARAELQAAEERARRAGQPAGEAEVKAAMAASQRAQAELEVARLQARESTILAPFSGMVAEVFAAAGALVAPGSPIMTVIPPNFELAVALPEAQLSQVAAGLPVKLSVDAYPDQEFTGAVRSIAPAVDTRHRTVAVRIDVQDPGFKLKAGMFAQVAVASPARQAVLLVPVDALPGRGAESSVYLVVDGRARRQPVQVGASDGRNVEILAGLSEGAEVVVSASAQAEGAVVR